MANEYRMIGIAFATETKRSVLEGFIGNIVCNGWEGPVSIGGIQPDSENVAEHLKAWGGYLYPDLRLMVKSSSGVTHTFRTEQALLGEFAHDDCLEQCEAILGSELYPGFTSPQPTDAIAIVMSDSRFAPPQLWIRTVIDKYYNSGLRFFFQCSDLEDLAYDGTPLTIFYSVESQCASDLKMANSEHCVAMRTTECVEWKSTEVDDNSGGR